MLRVREASSCGEGEGESDDNEMGVGMVVPSWLQVLMGETFFGGCVVHQNHRKNEKNVFCLHCCISICPHCLPSHCSHPLLQVRRYVYHDVVRLSDLEKLIDCSLIQPYTINSAKVIFLKQRSQSRSCKCAAKVCLTCDRMLHDEFKFCSVYCKVHFAPAIIHNSSDLAFTRLGQSQRGLPRMVLSFGSRRKGAPHRAPFS